MANEIKNKCPKCNGCGRTNESAFAVGRHCKTCRGTGLSTAAVAEPTMPNEIDRDSELWKALKHEAMLAEHGWDEFVDKLYLIATAHAEKRVADVTKALEAWREIADGYKTDRDKLAQPRTHSDPIAALAHTNAELVKATERINKLEAEALAWMNRYEAAQRKLAETPWEVRHLNGHILARYAASHDARSCYGDTYAIRNTVTGEEVQP